MTTLPGFRGVGSIANGNPGYPGTCKPSAPTCADGDLLIAVILTGTNVTSTPPPGWQLEKATNFGQLGVAPNVQIYSKPARNVDSNQQFSFSIPIGTSEGFIFVDLDGYGVEQILFNFSEHDPGDPVAQTLTAPPVATTRPNQLIHQVFIALPPFFHDSGTFSGEPATVRLTNDPGTNGHVGFVLCDQPQTSSGTTPTQSMHVNSPGSYWTAFTLSVYPNDPPNVDTLLSPPDGAVVNVDLPQRFIRGFSDIDPGDGPSGFDFGYIGDGDADWTVIHVDGPNGYIDIPAGTFTADLDYQWRTRSYDLRGAVSPSWCTPFHFSAESAPDAPAITAPISDEIIGDATVQLLWTQTGQEGYQVRLWPDDGSGSADTAGTPIFDSGQVIDSITRGLPVLLDATGVVRHLEVSVRVAGLWSPSADVRFSVNFDPPATPSLTLSINDDPPTITCYITNPAPTGDELPAVYNDIEVSFDGRETWAVLNNINPSSAMLPPNGQWTYWGPAAGVDHNFRVKAVTDAGTYAYSDSVDDAVIDEGAPAWEPPLIPGGSP